MSAWIPQAITELQQQRDQIDVAIAALQRLQPVGTAHVPTDRPTASKRRGQRPRRDARASGVGKGLDPAAPDVFAPFLAAIGDGPASLDDIARATKVTKANLRYRLKQLVESGRIRADGATSKRRYYPAGAKAPKEAPSRR